MCSMHGGKSLSGIALPQTTTGRYSKVLPHRLVAAYNESLDDPDLLSLRHEIGLIDTRLADVLRRVDTGEVGRSWDELRQAVSAAKDAKLAKNWPALDVALSHVDDAIALGATESDAWSEIRQLVQERRKVAESERKRQVEMGTLISLEKISVMQTYLLDSIRRHVTDRDALEGIAADMRRMAGV